MDKARRSLFGLLIGIGLIRAVGFLVYAEACLPTPVEAYYLESKMVLLAFRAEMGLSLYTEWRDYPHVANFFGPAYFEAVGLLGRASGADIPGLFRIGRWASFTSALLSSLVIGVAAARRYGPWPGIAGAIVGMGIAPMFGFSVMVRPDLAAHLLGVAGFFAALHRATFVRAVGGILLVLAVLTKQTAAIFLLAASLAWFLEGEWRRGLRLVAGGSIALVVLVGSITWLAEPNFAISLIEEAKTPWELDSLVHLLLKLAQLSPDLLYFPALGVGLWASGATGRRELGLAGMAGLLLAVSVVSSAKRGADLNYFLGLHAAEGLAIAALWRAWTISTGRARSVGLLIATVLGTLSVGPGALDALLFAQFQRGEARYLAGPLARELLEFNRQACAMAADPNSRLLTDSGFFDLYQGERAAFGDPWLFRMLTETGRIDPAVMRSRIDNQYYDLIITTRDLGQPSYEAYPNGLPMTLVQRARDRYFRVGSRAGMFLYRRRPGETIPTIHDRSGGGGSPPDRP